MQLSAELREAALDPQRTFHVRDLRLSRGDVTIYLTDGILSFLKPVTDRTLEAVFTTSGVDAGDAEILLMPPLRSERVSLSHYYGRPNLDEHFASAVFLFSDATATEITRELEDRAVEWSSSAAQSIPANLLMGLRTATAAWEEPLLRSLLDDHNPGEGFFCALIESAGHRVFEVAYDRGQRESVSVGAIDPTRSRYNGQIWTQFRARHDPPYTEPKPRIRNYAIDLTVGSDSRLSASAKFVYEAKPSDGRAVELHLSERLLVKSAKVDGKAVEVFQPAAEPHFEFSGSRPSLLVAPSPLTPGDHSIEIAYEGGLIAQVEEGEFLVADRMSWYPYVQPTYSAFDLTLHVPANVRVASTGALVSDEVRDDVRTVHRRTSVPVPLAGFNIGQWTLKAEQVSGYTLETYAPTESKGAASIDAQAQAVLQQYTSLWPSLLIKNLSITPVPGRFGQGFPGLIYLSDIAYMPAESRPADLRGVVSNTFFSRLLLPHEMAHQWWGNLVTNVDYRSAWIPEAMSNYSAIQFTAHSDGTAAARDVLRWYRNALTRLETGSTPESAGPIDFGTRLAFMWGPEIWHVITYEKGTWILQMLHNRMGDQAFRAMQVRVLTEFQARPLSNEDLRRVASAFLPADDPDRDLSQFFDTWIHNTGIPALFLLRDRGGLALVVTRVDEDFVADIPLRCGTDHNETRWIRVSAGTNSLARVRGASSCELPDPDAFLYTSP